MRKTSLLFIPLLLTLSCKKNSQPFTPIETEKPKFELDMSNPLQNVITSEYEKSSDAILYTQRDINFLGFLTDTMSVKEKKFNPFNYVGLINTEYSLTDVNAKTIGKYKLDTAILHTYRASYAEMLRNSNHIFTPKISYQIYATKEAEGLNKTEITLIIKAIYYYLVLNHPKDENFKTYAHVKIDQVKQSGAYLSRMGFGMQSSFRISTSEDPKKYIAYLKAYLNAILSNNEKDTKEIKKEFQITTTGYGFLGGPISSWFQYESLNNNEKIEKYIKELFVAKPTNSSFNNIEFDFKALK